VWAIQTWWRRSGVSLQEAAEVSVERAADLIAVDDALTRLSELDARKGHVVVEETAEVLQIFSNTVLRDGEPSRRGFIAN
jgi:hypothetical protein